MNLLPSPLETWFTTHPGPHGHALASTAAGPWTREELAAFLPADWDQAVDWGYSEPAGLAPLRAAIAQTHGVALEQVLLTQGAVEANWLALACLVRPGDRVVVQTPSYPQLACVAASLGATVVPWHVGEDLSQPPDLHALARLLERPTRLLLLNFPHNPTGRVADEATLRAIGALVEAAGPDTYWLVDEVYREVGAGPLPPSASRLGARAIATHSTSKAWALPGLRLGWLVGPVEVVEAALRWREHTALALSGPSEALALALWPRRGELIAANQALVGRNRRIVEAWLATGPGLAGPLSPEAACCLLRPPRPVDDVALAEAAYAAERLLLIPGATLGYPGAFRLGYGHRDEAALRAALAAAGRFIGSHALAT